jgi:sugar/nucleoside kinase (ribokinase family)
LKPSLVVFGSFTIDDLVFSDGATRWAVPGGSAVYAAFGASIWTERPAIVAPLGDDYPRELLDGHFDLSRCPQIPRSLRNWGLYEDDGTRHFISRRASRNWREFCPDPKAALAVSQAAAHIGPVPHDVAIGLVRNLRCAESPLISLDLDDHDLAGTADLESLIELLLGIDLFLPSFQNAQAFFGGTDALDVLRRMRSAAPSVPLIAVKCGAKGVIAHAVGVKQCVHVPAVPVNVEDATGAGDAFCGGVLAGFLKEREPVKALVCGTVSASFCVEGLGLAGLATATHDNAEARRSVLCSRLGTL